MLVEHLICNQHVGGSNPFASSRPGSAGRNQYLTPRNATITDRNKQQTQYASNTRFPKRQIVGEVAKRSNAADCKSVALAASKVRVLPSPYPPSLARAIECASYGGQARDPGYDVSARLEAGLPAEARDEV